MKRFRVVWCHYFQPEVQNKLPPEKFEILPCSDQKELENLISIADFLVIGRYAKATKAVIERGRNLKLIQRAGVLYHDHVDVEAATKAGIPVSVMPMTMAMSVAEHAITLILALSKELLEAHRATVLGEYQALGIKPAPTSERSIPNANWMRLSPQVLYQKVLGIIGMGEIGLAVAKRAKSFGMKIIYSDVRRLPTSYEEELNATYVPFETLLREADYVTLHAPHTKETEKMISTRELSLMKKSAFLINTSRGGVVDENALHKALEENGITGAGLDVFLMEPVPKDNPLLKLKNVILTPHIAGVSQEAAIKDFDLLCSNILRVANGEGALNVVNKQ